MDDQQIVEELKAIAQKKVELEKAFNQLNPLEFFVGGYRAAGGKDLPMDREDVVKLKGLLQEYYASINQAAVVLDNKLPKNEGTGPNTEPTKMEVKKSSTPKKK